MMSELKGSYKVMLFPCNQFLGQEPGKPSKDSIKRMSTGKLNDVTSDEGVLLMEKAEVNGDNAHPVFEYLRYNSSLYNESTNKSSPIPWNFGKFLVDPKGGVFKYYSPQAKIAEVREDLQKLLAGTAEGMAPRRASVK